MRVLFPDPLSPMRRCTPEWVKDTLTLLIAWTRVLPDVNVLDSDSPLIVGFIWFFAFV